MHRRVFSRRLERLSDRIVGRQGIEEHFEGARFRISITLRIINKFYEKLGHHRCSYFEWTVTRQGHLFPPIAFHLLFQVFMLSVEDIHFSKANHIRP